MTLVLDGSVALAWVFTDERDAVAEAVLNDVKRDGAVVPNLWALEVANSLLQAERRGRLSLDNRRAALSGFGALRITVDHETNRHAWAATLELAERHGLTVYDSSYLELALRLDLPLASRDKALRRAALERGVPILG